MSIDELTQAIQNDIEWLETTQDGVIVECISIENLESILSLYLKTTIKLSES